MGKTDRELLAVKLRDLAEKLDDIVTWHRLNYPAEMDICSAAAGIRAAANDVCPSGVGEYSLVRCGLCGLLQGRETGQCAACHKGLK